MCENEGKVMPLDTEREQRQQEELIRLSAELARKNEIIAALQAANMELHDIAEQARMPKRMPPHRCAGCGSEIAAEAVAYAGGAAWICVECVQRG